MRQRQSGFTLIEMIVVLVIMTLIASLVLIRQPWHSAAIDTEATVRSLTAGLRLARSRAIVQDRPVSVMTAAEGFAIDGGTPQLLPAGETLSRSQVVFLPDGGSSGATIFRGRWKRSIRCFRCSRKSGGSRRAK